MRDFPMSLALNSGRVSAIDDRHRNDGLYALIAIEVAREQGWDHESSPVTGLSLTVSHIHSRARCARFLLHPKIKSQDKQT